MFRFSQSALASGLTALPHLALDCPQATYGSVESQPVAGTTGPERYLGDWLSAQRPLRFLADLSQGERAEDLAHPVEDGPHSDQGYQRKQ